MKIMKYKLKLMIRICSLVDTGGLYKNGNIKANKNLNNYE